MGYALPPYRHKSQWLRDCAHVNASDQDGISAVVCKWPDLVRDYSEAVLTPNFPEYQRLCMSVGVAVDTPIDELAKR